MKYRLVCCLGTQKRKIQVNESEKRCAIIIGSIIYLTGLIPSIAGYMHVLGIEELKVNVNKLYEPSNISWNIVTCIFGINLFDKSPCILDL